MLRNAVLGILAAIGLAVVGSTLTAPPACADGSCPGYQCTSSSQCITCGCAIKVGEAFGWCR
jgi:hypothetical protein